MIDFIEGTFVHPYFFIEDVKQRAEYSFFVFYFGSNLAELDEKKILSQQELLFSRQLFAPNRLQSFLCGRYVAKRALQLYLGKSIEMNRIPLLNGESRFPYFASHNYSVTISHCSNLAVATVLDPRYFVGVDIEHKNHFNDTNVNLPEVKDREKNLRPPQVVQFSWVAMESLSKALKIGFTVDFELLRVKSIRSHPEGGYLCEFENFPNFKSIIVESREVVFSICFYSKNKFFLDQRGLRDKLSRFVQ